MSTPGIVAFDQGFQEEGDRRKREAERDADRAKRDALDQEAAEERKYDRQRKRTIDARQDTAWERNEAEYQRQLKLLADEDEERNSKQGLTKAMRLFVSSGGDLTQPLVDFYNQSVPDGSKITKMVRGKDGKYKVETVEADGTKRNSVYSYDEVGKMAMALADPAGYFRSIHESDEKRSAAMDKIRTSRTGKDEIYSSVFRSYVEVEELRKEYRKAKAERDANLAKLQTENPTAYTAESGKAFPGFDAWAESEYGVKFKEPEAGATAIPDGSGATNGAPGAAATPDNKGKVNVYQALTMLAKTPDSVKSDPQAFEAHIRKMFSKGMSPNDLDILVHKALNPKGGKDAGGGAPPVPVPGGTKPGASAPSAAIAPPYEDPAGMPGGVAHAITAPAGPPAPAAPNRVVPPDLEQKRAALTKQIKELESLVGDGTPGGKIAAKKNRRNQRVDDKHTKQLTEALALARAEYDRVQTQIARIQSGVP
jgi:hypothetical protein